MKKLIWNMKYKFGVVNNLRVNLVDRRGTEMKGAEFSRLFTRFIEDRRNPPQSKAIPDIIKQ
jgi:hypothetical protein